jgi:pimeloyl-ACP methyl ester carboxylesterase
VNSAISPFDSVRAVDAIRVRSPDGTTVACEVAGAGPPLLLVHGSTADRHRWVLVRDRLEARFTLHLMDRRGRGLSAAAPGAPGEYALAREAEDVAAVLTEIGPGARLLAHSYGGTVALEALANGAAPARALVYEPAFGTAAGPVFPIAALERVDAALARDDPGAALAAFFTDVLLLPAAEVEAMRRTEAWRVRAAVAHTLPREARAANAWRPDPVALAARTTPVRFLLGTESASPLARSTRAAHAALPGSDLRILPGHGHAAMDADPELFAREVTDWLAPEP